MRESEYRTVGRRAGGKMFIRTWLLHQIGRALGVQFHIGAWPYGASWRRAINNNHEIDDGQCAAYAENGRGDVLGVKTVWASVNE